jgi:hypothetical protein
MRQFMENESWVESFDSLADSLVYASDNDNRKSSDSRDAFEFTQTRSLDEAITLGTTGWHDIRPQVDSLFARVEPSCGIAMGDMFETRFDVSGDSGDIDRYLSGEPECMIDYVNVPQARMGRIVRILINGSVSCRVSAEDIMKRGVTVTVLVDILNRLGVGVEVYLENCTRSGNKYHSLLVKLHDSAELLDIDNLMFAVAHPSMLRRISFSNMEKSKWGEAKKIIQGGYGSANAVKLADYLQADVVVDMLESATGNYEDDAYKYVMSTVRGLGLVEC